MYILQKHLDNLRRALPPGNGTTGEAKKMRRLGENEIKPQRDIQRGQADVVDVGRAIDRSP
jgi:hypothetical protein